jgi:hypothetical protein
MYGNKMYTKVDGKDRIYVYTKIKMIRDETKENIIYAFFYRERCRNLFMKLDITNIKTKIKEKLIINLGKTQNFNIEDLIYSIPERNIPENIYFLIQKERKRLKIQTINELEKIFLFRIKEFKKFDVCDIIDNIASFI